MEAIRILDGAAAIGRNYDEEADVLYLSVGEPRPAEGIDIGEGLVLRYDRGRKEVVGLTVIGLRARLLAGLADERAPKQDDAGRSEDDDPTDLAIESRADIGETA